MDTVARSTAFADRRQRILLAAARLFSESPYDAVHVDEIALAARVAKPTVYRYFATKEALFAEALEQAIDELSSAVGGICVRRETAEERLRSVITLVLDRVGHLKAVWRAMESEGVHLNGQGRLTIRRRFRELSGRIAQVLREGHEDGAFGSVDPELSALVLLGGLRMAASAERNGSDHNHAESIADLFLSGLKGPHGGLPRERPAAFEVKR